MGKIDDEFDFDWNQMDIDSKFDLLKGFIQSIVSHMNNNADTQEGIVTNNEGILDNQEIIIQRQNKIIKFLEESHRFNLNEE